MSDQIPFSRKTAIAMTAMKYITNTLLIFSFVLLVKPAAAQQSNDPKRWLSVPELKGSFNINAGGKTTPGELDNLLENTMSFIAQGTFKVKFSKEQSSSYPNELVYIGVIKGSMSFLSNTKGVGGKILQEKNNCGGKLIESIDSSYCELKIDVKHQSYNINFYGAVPCRQTMDVSKGELHEVEGKLQPTGEMATETIDDFGRFGTVNFYNNPASGYAFPLPKSGKSFSGSNNGLVTAGFLGLPMDASINWWIEMNPLKVEVKNLSPVNLHCVLSKNQDEEKTVELTAFLEPAGTDGEFEKFEVRMGSKPCKIVQNTGGKNPLLVLKGNAKRNDKVNIVAIYKKKGELIFSEPFELNWCMLEKPELKDNPYNALTGRNDCFLFSEDNPGRITIDAKTTLWYNGKENKDDFVEWEISPNPDKMFTSEEYKNGREVKIRVEKLPENNKDFGIKNIKAKYDAEGCLCESEETEVQIFFPADSKNNPEGKYPNWFYYWKQTKAWSNPPNWVYFDDNLPDSKYKGEVARYNPYTDQIYISKWAGNQTYGKIVENGGWRYGIDCFATGVRHEECHRTELISWWGLKMVNYSELNDCDMDLVPNTIEEQNAGCKSGCLTIPLDAALKLATGKNPSQYSCNKRPEHMKDQVTDMEMNAYECGWNAWEVGKANDEDWSCPGKQCPGQKMK